MAITLDSSAKSGTAWVTGTITYAHNNVAGDYLDVVIRSGTDSVTGVTYAGVSMTQLAKSSSGGVYYHYGLAAPATGSNNVVVSVTGSENRWSASEALIGAKQTGQPDASNFGSSASSPNTVSVTTVADNSWLIGIAQGGGSLTGGTGTTLRQDGTGGTDTVLLDSNGVKTPAGSYSLVCNYSSGTNYLSVISIAPAVTARRSHLLTLGIS